ncbi:MAG: OmpA family protein [Nitrospirota bacterium]|nr:OmpA family protein [Nitrospirota bacterium]MDH5586064.1 OmpA family protein [Nitrospirota bacterium]MDH5774616.1 OmpA family protein [Nitrospirota bacterium]
MTGKIGIVVVTFCGMLGTWGCADDPYRQTKTGAVIGGAAGAGIGAIIDKKHRGRGAAIGGAIGVLTGGGVGYYMDRQQREIEAQLAKEMQDHAIEVKRLEDNTLQLNLRSEATFDVNSAAVKPGFQDSLAKVGTILSKYDSTVVHVIGHTDNTGGDTYNQQLSEKRADAVADHLHHQEVKLERLLASGRGELDPISNNDTTEGRRVNRRVELFLKPVVEGKEDWAYQPPTR